MLKKNISLVLVIFHLIVFGPIREASAFYAQSANFGFTSSVLTQGGMPRQGIDFKVVQDAIGATLVGKIQSSSYVLESGYIPALLSTPPVQKQIIPNQIWQQNTSKQNAFDLDDYFISPDGLVLVYSVSGQARVAIAIDAQTHVVSFSQADGWSGTEKVRFTAQDTENNQVVSNEVTLQVEGGNNAPVLDFIPDLSVNENELVVIAPHATDADGGVVIYTFSAPLNAQGEWQTSYEDSGLYTITVTAIDATNLSASQEVRINVKNVNRPPVLDLISAITAKEGDLVTIAPHATDADGNALTYYYAAPFDSSGKWLTGYDDAGDYVAAVTVSDGIDMVSQDVPVVIQNTNRVPEVVLALSDYTVNPNEVFSINVLASDPDGDGMNVLVKKDSQEIASGPVNGSYTVQASFSDMGDHAITVTVTDSGGLVLTVTQGVDVIDPNINKYAINPVMGDFNGDSLTDLGLHNSETGAWEICISDNGVFRNAVDWLNSFGSTREWAPVGGDFNGDGKTDVGIYNSATGELKTALSNGAGFTAQGAWLNFSESSASWQVVTGNYNADKYTDFAVYNKDTGEVRAALSTGSGFSGFNSWLNSGDAGFAASGGDFNGDGLTDICLYKKASGEFKVVFSNSSAFVDAAGWGSGLATGKDPIFADFNHDGLTDAGYWDQVSFNWYYAISNGNRFVDRGAWLDGYGASSDEVGTTGDFNGDGVLDRALFKRDAEGIDRWKTQLSAQKIPDLLTVVDNGIGGKTQVAYAYASAGDNPGLPFPVNVASTVTVTDTLPTEEPEESYAQNFTFSGGYYDAAEREFRGFSRVKAKDPITGNYTETYFYLGKTGEDGALKGQIQKVLAYDGNGRQISETNNTYEVRKAGPENNVLGFPALKEQAVTVWEEDGSMLATKSRLAYDNIGNVAEAVSEGDVSKVGDEKTTQTIYAQAYTAGFNRPTESVLKDKDGNVVTKKNFAYDAKGNLLKEKIDIFNFLITDHGLSTMDYVYDVFGNVISTTNALGHAVTTEYETIFNAFPRKVTNALGHSVAYAYDPKFGVVTSVTDPNGKTSGTAYDSFGRVLTTTNALGNITATYDYPDFNTKVGTNAIGLSKTEYADGLGRKYKSVSTGEDGGAARDVSVEVYYNNRGSVDRESIAHYVDEDAENIAYIRYEYDLRGRVKKTISDFPGTLKDAESGVNYISPLYTETIDPEGHKKGTLKDVYGNVVEVFEFTSDGIFNTAYEYDVQGNLVKLTDAKGNVSQIWYDSLGRKLKMNDPDMGVWAYEYDLLGNLIKQTDAKEQILEFQYDVLNRLTGKLANGQTIVTYQYDEQSKENCIGRLSKITDSSGSTEFFYDELGREIKSIKTVQGTGHTVQREYDVLDRLTKLVYPDGQSVDYSYDVNSGLLEKVFSADSGPSSVDYVKNITYNAKNQITTIQYGNGTQTDYTYGQDLRLSRISTQGASALQDLNYIFDNNGNIITLTDNLRNNIRTFVYDDLDRLTQAQNIPNASGGYGDFNYQYDAIGNMIYKSDVGVMSYGEGALRPHAVTLANGYSYQYDANGNMTSGKNKTLEYDAENRIIKITEPSGVTDFVYDGDGGRVKQSIRLTGQPDNRQTIYIGSLFEIQKAGDGSQKTVRHIFAGSNKVCSISTEEGNGKKEVIYFHSDHLGSSNVVTDENGQQVGSYEYTPYGSLINRSSNLDLRTSYLFTGKELDSTGLYFYGARYYDPELGRFVTADTIVQSPYDPQSLNRYSYCRNNPLNYVDPTGHFFWFIVAAIVGAVLGGASAAMNGGNVGMGILMGAVGGACVAAGAAGAYALWGSAWAFVGAAAGGAASGAANAAVSGGNIGYSALIGAVGAGVGCGVGYALGPALGAFGSAIAGGFSGGVAGGGLGAALNGGDIGQGIWQGAAYGTVGAVVGYGASRTFSNSNTNTQKTIQDLKTDQKPEYRARLKTNYDIEGKPASFDLDYTKGFSTSKQTTVIGSRQDTLIAKGWANHNVLDLPPEQYTWAKNIEWLNGAIQRGDTIYMATDTRVCTGTYGQTYLKEVLYLELNGYSQDGQYMVRK